MNDAFGWKVVAAVVFALTHLMIPHFSKLLDRDEVRAGSLGGGLAVAFVFLELLPKIGHEHAVIGETIEFITFAGFLAMFALFRIVHVRQHEHKTLFPVRLGIACTNSFLLVYSFPFSTGLYDAITCLLLVVHIAFIDHDLRGVSEEAFDRYGRWLLAGFAFLGWGVLSFVGHGSELGQDVFTGLLAGFMMYQVFCKEVPLVKSTSYFWFLGGAALFLSLHVLQRWSGGT